MLRTIQEFKAIWEEKERSNLRDDRKRRIAQLDREREFAETGEGAKMQEEEDKAVDEELAKQEADSFPDEESKDLFSKHLRAQHLAKLFKDKDEWKNSLLSLKKATVLKLPRLL